MSFQYARRQLVVAQKQKKYRVLQFTCLGGEFISTLTPFIVLGIANNETWFQTEDGWKVGLGGSLALALMGIAVFLVTKRKDEETKASNGWLTLLVGWFAVAFIFILLANIMDQIATIMLWGGLGLCGAFGLDLTSKSFKTKADLYKEAIGEVRKDKLKEQINQEVEEEKKKVKIKVVK